MKKNLYFIILLMLIIVNIFSKSVFAQDLLIKLKFPRKSTQKINSLSPIKSIQEVSGVLLLDVSPYPEALQKDRYFVEYFLNKEFLFSTNGIKDDESRDLDLDMNLIAQCSIMAYIPYMLIFGISRVRVPLGH